MSLIPSTVGRRLLILTMFSQRRPQIQRCFGLNFKHDATDILFFEIQIENTFSIQKKFWKTCQTRSSKTCFQGVQYHKQTSGECCFEWIQWNTHGVWTDRIRYEFWISLVFFRGCNWGRRGGGRLNSAHIPFPLGNDFPLGQQHTSLIIQVIKTLEYKESAWHKSNLVLDSSYAGLYHRVNMSPLTHWVDQLYMVPHVRCA